MRLDLVIVTYNSSKWIPKLLNSILISDYNLKNIGLYFCDNDSCDDTIELLTKGKKMYEKNFNNFEIIKSKKNVGFGRANNIAFKKTAADYIFFLNVDCEVYCDTFKKIVESIKDEKNNKIGIFELRQLPYEHPKYYDPVTGYTSWSSGAAFVIKRELFHKVGGFDRNLFMYCEDVELSWHIRKMGYYIKYLFNVPVIHYSYTNSKFKINQFINTTTNNIYMRLKYGKLRNVIGGLKLFISVIKGLNNIDSIPKSDIGVVRKKMIKNETKMFFLGVGAYFSRIQYLFSRNNEFKSLFVGFDYEASKIGSFYEKRKIIHNDLVSIIVRTCERPNVLRETLISLRNQTYKNLEVLIIEDGKNKSEQMIKTEFQDLNIKYYCTNQKVGRCKAGNLGLKKATGKYLNFLDDDDLFYPDHVETLLSEIQNCDHKIVYSVAFETSINILSRQPYRYKISDISNRYCIDFSYLKLLYGNITPIQAVMFEKKVFENCGGFDEEMDALEDWDLWIRYALEYPFKLIPRTTSLYRVPADKKDIQARTKFLTEPLTEVRKKYENKVISIKVNDFYDYIKQFEVPVKSSKHKFNLLNIIKKIIKKIIKNSEE